MVPGSGSTVDRRGFLRATGGSVAAVGPFPSFELVAPPEPDVDWTVTVADEADLRAVVDATAYVAGETLYALDAADGRERWRLDGPGRVRPEAVGDGTVFVGRDGDVEARSVATGDHRWTLESARLPRYHDGTVYAVNRGTTGLFALDAGDGSEQWHVDRYVRPLAAPSVGDDDGLYVGDAGRVHAFDSATGADRWTAAVHGDSFVHPALTYGALSTEASPTVGDVLPTWNTNGGTLLGISTTDGSERWRVDHPRDFNSPPVAHRDGTLYVGGNHLTAHDAATGAEQWRYSPGVDFGAPRVADDAVYVSDGSAVHAVDAASGARRWRFRSVGQRPVSVGGVVDGTVPVSSFDGWLAALDAADGGERWRYDHGGEPAWFPILADGRLYLGTRDGRTVALADPADTASPLGRLKTAPTVAGLATVGAVVALGTAGYRRLGSGPG